MNVVVYTDASYCQKTDTAACGYVVIANGKIIKHDVLLVAGLKKVSNAEVFSIVQALQFSFLLNEVRTITVNTDHKGTVTRTRKKIMFKELDETIDIIREYSIGVNFFHVRGHSNNYYNNLVDKSCNYNLRKYLNKQKNEKGFTRIANRNDSVRL